MMNNRRLAYIEGLKAGDITLAAEKKYIKSANHCPFCKKEHGGAWLGDEWHEGTDKQKPTVRVRFECAACNRRYIEVYKLYKVEKEKKEGEEE